MLVSKFGDTLSQTVYK